MSATRPTARLILSLALATAPPLAAQEPPRAQPDPPPPGAGVPAALEPGAGAARPFVQEIPGTLVSLELVPVAPGLWLARGETTWDAYDAFVFGLDRPAAPEGAGDPPPDAVLRPSKPHMVTDRGWGHAGYPAMSISARGAAAFCEWLSAATGRRFRLPTEAEWEAACRAGAPAAETDLQAVSWYRENANRRTHAAGSKAADALGLHDLRGNVAEWCLAPDGTHVLRGGSFRDASKDLACDARRVPEEAWNRSDPNLPKSVWWLADAPFAGFRVACEGEPGADGAPRAAR